MLMKALPELLVAVSGVYFYFYFRRIAELAGLRTELAQVRAGLAVLAAVFVLPAMDVWNFWAVVVLYLLACSILTDLLHAAVRRAGKDRGAWSWLYRSGLLPVAALALLLLYGWWNMHHITEKTYTVYTEKEIRESGYRIAFLSDLHYGTTMGAEELADACAAVSREGPDLVVLGGDLVDEHTTKAEMQEAFRILSDIRAEYGIYYIYGNHDRGFYEEETDFTMEELDQAIAKTGIQILKDDTVTVNGELTLAGRDDRTNPECGRRKSSEALLDGADRNQFLLLLDHQPRELEKNAALGCDLQLSGHTHGGQIWPVGEICPLLGFGEMNYGYRTDGTYRIIVSSGIAGGNYPFRTGKHCEYVMVNLWKAKEQPVTA